MRAPSNDSAASAPMGAQKNVYLCARNKPAACRPALQSAPMRRMKWTKTSAITAIGLNTSRGVRLTRFFLRESNFANLTLSDWADFKPGCFVIAPHALLMINSPAMQPAQATAVSETVVADQKLVRGLGLFDSTMLVAGSMIGSGIFIVSAIIARQVGSPGWLLVVWIVTGLLTMMAALSYGELAAMMPKAGGQYVYLREAYSPLWGFLYGWTLFLVIQTGTIAAVAVGFARYSGVLIPWFSESKYIIAPIRFGGWFSGYAVSLSTAQLLGLAMIALLTFMNTRGLNLGKLVQNIFTTAKTGALIALVV